MSDQTNNRFYRETAPTPADVPGQSEVSGVVVRASLDEHGWRSKARECLCGWRPDVRIRQFPEPQQPPLIVQWNDHVAAEVVKALGATESYTIAQIRAAFAKHARPDDWNVRAFYERGLIAALRGEYDNVPSTGGDA